MTPIGPDQSAVPFDPQRAAQHLLAARQGGSLAAWGDVLPPDLEAVYAVQEATVAALGEVMAWKVGAKSLLAQPIFAPLPAGDYLSAAPA